MSFGEEEEASLLEMDSDIYSDVNFFVLFLQL
jgi:hypothetical protein